jgi:acetolactate synthase-1/2/3 large subunit
VRPVGLELPPDMLAKQEEVDLVAPLPAEPPSPLDEDAIAEAAAALDAAECPLIFVGGGALDASAEIRALAERLAAPVIGYRRGTYISSGYQGTLGWGLATSLGAKHALGPTPVVSITGDGGFMFNVQEFATAVRHRIPLVVVLFNDGAYGNVRNMQRHDHGNRVIATDLANPDFMRLAASFGIGGYRASDPGGLRVALERALAQNEPALIEVPCGTLPDPWRFIDMPKVRGM